MPGITIYLNIPFLMRRVVTDASPRTSGIRITGDLERADIQVRVLVPYPSLRDGLQESVSNKPSRRSCCVARL